MQKKQLPVASPQCFRANPKGSLSLSLFSQWHSWSRRKCDERHRKKNREASTKKHKTKLSSQCTCVHNRHTFERSLYYKHIMKYIILPLFSFSSYSFGVPLYNIYKKILGFKALFLHFQFAYLYVSIILEVYMNHISSRLVFSSSSIDTPC